MDFKGAVQTCLQDKYAVFSGRGRRSEYWFFSLFAIVAEVVGLILRAVLGPVGLAIYAIIALGLIVPGLAAFTRRMHDTGRSGWWWLIGLIPLVGSIILIVFLATDSGPDNQYGPNPKGLGSGFPEAGGYPTGQQGYGQQDYGQGPSSGTDWGTPR